MRFDLHSHVVPPPIIAAMEKDPERFQTRITEKDGRRYFDVHGRPAELSADFHDVDAKLAWMDRNRIDVSVISVGPPIFFYWLSPEAGLAAAKLANDGIAQMVAQHPSRLRGMAHLPMQDPDAAITELERVVEEHGFKAVELATSIEGAPLADPKFRKVLKTIEQLGCFVFAHPYRCLAEGGMAEYYLRNFVGFPLDTTLMVAHLMFSGAMDELPQLRILLAHGGGFVPYQIGRFCHGHQVREEPKVNHPTPPRELFKRFYFDCLTHDPKAARYLIDQVGAERVVIGTDHPFDMAPLDVPAAVDGIPGLSAEQKAWVCERTARTLLGEA
jgi:aminocarboxymuconate-semialdehyde decarboxylase